MKFYLMLAVLEYIVLYFITSGIDFLNYDYVNLKYSTFRFSNEDEENGLNVLIKIFFPTVYLIVISGILYKLDLISLDSNIYYVTILYHIINWLVLTVVLKRIILIDKRTEIKTTFLSIVLSLFMYYIFINKTTDIFFDFDDLKNGIWLAIITFCVSVFLKKIYYGSKINIEEHNDRITKYIMNNYNYFKQKYDHIITTDNVNMRYLVYAIMIFENYNRPWFARKLEYLKLFFFKNATLGIMQVNSKKYISDEESIKKGVAIIENSYKKLPKNIKKEKKIEKVLYEYNCSNKYVNEVKYIYEFLQQSKLNNIWIYGIMIKWFTLKGSDFMNENKTNINCLSCIYGDYHLNPYRMVVCVNWDHASFNKKRRKIGKNRLKYTHFWEELGDWLVTCRHIFILIKWGEIEWV